jgi:hypothetical protein
MARDALYIHFNASGDASVNREHVMTDNILSAVLAISLMVTGGAAIGSELFASQHAARVATLPAVSVTGQRGLPMAEVVLPTVMVTGCRHGATTVAIETSDVEKRAQ